MVRLFHRKLLRIVTGQQTASIRQAVMKILLYNKEKTFSSDYRICYSILLLTLFILISQVSAAEVTRLQIDDCAKCHAFRVKMVAAQGGKHASEISCLDCHPQHLPNGKNTKEPCIFCHEGQPHFQVRKCLRCHANPHKPIESLRDPLNPEKTACLSCHPEVGQQMTAAPSRHTKLFCNRCHSRHKEIPGCLECHEPHLQQQVVADCLRCHSAHQPMKITPTGYVPATFCRVCHKKQADDLAETKTNHVGINCVNCHKGLHPSVPRCQDCHGLPHARTLHSRYRNCLECHVDAHLLISNY